MRSKITGFAGGCACVLLFAGCAELQQGAVPCEAPRETVIRVENGIPKVDQEPIHVCKSDVKITWVLDSSQQSQYDLRGDSIVVTDPDGEFANCKGSGNGGELDGSKKIKCRDLNNKHGTGLPPRRYHYTIKVYSVGTALDEKPAATYDPTIMND